MGEKPTSRVRIFIDGEELDVATNQEIFNGFEELDVENDDITVHDWQDFWGDTY